MTSPRQAHINVCICTFRRPDLLERLLGAVAEQQTQEQFVVSATVVDNDIEESARSSVDRFSRTHALAVTYCVEPRQNIALARNRAIAAALGDYVALIDDDEMPDERWLLTLYEAVQRQAVDGMLAPVLPLYSQQPPAWVLKGRFFDRPAPATGRVLHWTQTRSGNALLKRAVFDNDNDWFDPAFGSGGEDRDFFKRKIAQGFIFAWSNEGAVREWVPAARWDLSFLLKRALLRGKVALRASDSVLPGVLKSALAVAAYGLALPVAALLGQHVLVHGLIRLCDHLGKVLAFLGFQPVRERYVQASPTADVQ
jgi:succinoglycan biosynthesis protein ExoM